MAYPEYKAAAEYTPICIVKVSGEIIIRTNTQWKYDVPSFLISSFDQSLTCTRGQYSSFNGNMQWED